MLSIERWAAPHQHWPIRERAFQDKTCHRMSTIWSFPQTVKPSVLPHVVNLSRTVRVCFLLLISVSHSHLHHRSKWETSIPHRPCHKLLDGVKSAQMSNAVLLRVGLRPRVSSVRNQTVENVQPDWLGNHFWQRFISFTGTASVTPADILHILTMFLPWTVKKITQPRNWALFM